MSLSLIKRTNYRIRQKKIKTLNKEFQGNFSFPPQLNMNEAISISRK